MAKEKILIKYRENQDKQLAQTPGGDWIDLFVNESIDYKAGDTLNIDLGIAMQLPKGYEALEAPRSSTFRKFGIIKTNHVGVYDNAFNGDNDWWTTSWFALKDGHIEKGDRISQMRIQRNQPALNFEEVLFLENEDRGGYGSTGR